MKLFPCARPILYLHVHALMASG